MRHREPVVEVMEDKIPIFAILVKSNKPISWQQGGVPPMKRK
jgi:hypothetical protein